jgi:O-antigen/teichoic acid export membrane protein
MWLTIAGAIVTLVLNFIWIPSDGYFGGYMGSAWATLICYSLMMVLSYFIGQKYFPVPYKVTRIMGYTALALGLYFIGHFTNTGSATGDLVFRNLIFGLFVIIVLLVEKPFNSRQSISRQ